MFYPNNRVKVLELLNREKQNGLLEGKTVIIVTHDEEIKNSGIFDHVLQVTKEHGVSKIEEVKDYAG